MNDAVVEVTLLTIRVSLGATAIAAACGLPAGAAIAMAPKSIRTAITPVLTAMMGIPPVVLGLAIYMLLSRQGPLGSFGLLYTPSAMVIAQAALVFPIITALTKEGVEAFLRENEEHLRSMGAKGIAIVRTALFQLRFSLMTVVLAGAGRAFAEVGAVFMVGGNIERQTRVLTTTIATETGKGELHLALWFGAVLMAVVLATNVLGSAIRQHAFRKYRQ